VDPVSRGQTAQEGVARRPAERPLRQMESGTMAKMEPSSRKGDGEIMAGAAAKADVPDGRHAVPPYLGDKKSVAGQRCP
jgi:hypothetical protein